MLVLPLLHQVLTPHGRWWPVMGVHLLSRQVRKVLPNHYKGLQDEKKKMVPDLHILLEVNTQFVCMSELGSRNWVTSTILWQSN